MEQIRENIARIRAEMERAALACGRDPKEILLCAATKMNDAEAVKIAVDSASGSLLQEGGSGAIPFALRREGEAFAGEVYTGAGQTQLSVDIALEDWFNAAAGEYGGAVTFRVSVEDREVAQ